MGLWLDIGNIRARKYKTTPLQNEKIWNTLYNLSKTPKEFRTISNFYTSVNDREMKEALIPYKIGGAFGKIF